MILVTIQLYILVYSCAFFYLTKKCCVNHTRQLKYATSTAFNWLKETRKINISVLVYNSAYCFWLKNVLLTKHTSSYLRQVLWWSLIVSRFLFLKLMFFKGMTDCWLYTFNFYLFLKPFNYISNDFYLLSTTFRLRTRGQCYKTFYSRKAVFPLAKVSTITPATVTCDSDTRQSLLTCLGHLGWRDINIKNPICVVPPKVAKASTVMCHCFANKCRHCKRSMSYNFS
jgi:hypothetical protein